MIKHGNSVLWEAKRWYVERKEILDGIKRFHYAVSSETDFIDIVESGHWKVDVLNKFVSEKGLDTSLAVDMVALMNNYDMAILVSGDADAIPSLNHIKRAGKHVCVVEFIKGYPPKKKGRQSSSKLKMVSDFVSQVYEMDIVKDGIGRRPEEHAQP